MQREFTTADLCDAYGEALQVVEVGLRPYGGSAYCCGPVRTLKLDEDNSELVRILRVEPGEGAVMVVDAGGAYCAIVGDTLMGYAARNGWAGIVLNGYVRDSAITRQIPVGLWALGTCPRKSTKQSPAREGERLHFAGVDFVPGAWLYADEDGIVLSERALIERGE